ncbi:predicted protein [Naegleria gruberi]|uniref:Predicted protein n=1 Tax=Naegleria gruberi TaxID=5762 RepID=D2VRV9_NAEGR|nr:uncharacterized protein NAEGRDRAFT_71721 [Naegleria gruberi]EFC40456.1 predicted protein [Naegleria gruberi]|eukprot:XP_002673200.1 predicted protein [Naegleria gruberi strain NEG-M]
MPFDSLLLHATILSRLDESNEKVLMIHYRDTAKKYRHLVRRISFEDNNGKLVGKLGKCELLNYFKHFNEKVRIISHCRVSETCYLYKIVSNHDCDTQLHFKSVKEFSKHTQWILIDLESRIVSEIEPYYAKLLPSSIPNESIAIDEDGFIQKPKRKKYFAIRNRKEQHISTVGFCDFARISLSSFTPFPYSSSNSSLVNVLCTVMVTETTTRHKKFTNENSVVFINYQFKLLKGGWKDLFEKTKDRSLVDIEIRFR